MKETACWIRGEIGYEYAQKDAVAMATTKCEFRKPKEKKSWQENDYICTHPAITSEYVESEMLPGGGVAVGGIEGFATFCEPIDMHRVSLGKTSRLIFQGKWRELTQKNVLPSPEEK